MNNTLPFYISPITADHLKNAIDSLIIAEREVIPNLTISPVKHTPAYIEGSYFRADTLEIEVSLDEEYELPQSVITEQVLGFFSNVTDTIKHLLQNSSMQLDLVFKFSENHKELETLISDLKPISTNRVSYSFDCEDFEGNFDYVFDKFVNIQPTIWVEERTITYKFDNNTLVFRRTLLKLIRAAKEGGFSHHLLESFLPQNVSKLPLRSDVIQFADKEFQKEILISETHSALYVDVDYDFEGDFENSIQLKLFNFSYETEEVIGHVSFPIIDGVVQVHFTQDDVLLNLAAFDSFFNGEDFFVCLYQELGEDLKINFIFPSKEIAELAKNNFHIDHLVEYEFVLLEVEFSVL